MQSSALCDTVKPVVGAVDRLKESSNSGCVKTDYRLLLVGFESLCEEGGTWLYSERILNEWKVERAYWALSYNLGDDWEERGKHQNHRAIQLCSDERDDASVSEHELPATKPVRESRTL